jgi:hypothetical protein
VRSVPSVGTLLLRGQHDLADLEAQFGRVAASYGESKGITYSAWREFGVATSKTGISRAS